MSIQTFRKLYHAVTAESQRQPFRQKLVPFHAALHETISTLLDSTHWVTSFTLFWRRSQYKFPSSQ